jgi:AraC-like DNA-binding protein
MNPAAFFRTDAVRRVLERASRAGSMPIAVHFVDGDRDRPPLAGVGRCQACQYVNKLDDGKAACLKSRVSASTQANQTRRPTPFLCHMGFACVSIPAFTDESHGLVVTMGPYCPAEAPETLVEDAIAGLHAVGGGDRPMFPVPLSDITLASATVAPAVIEWTAETLTELWHRELARERVEVAEEPSAEATAPRRISRRGRGRTPDTSPYRGADIAAALAGGNQSQARTLVRSAVLDVANQGEVLAIRRARTIAVVGAALEAAERAGLETIQSWEEFPAFLVAVRQARTDSELVTGAMALLAIILRRTARASTDGTLAELNRIVMDQFPEGIQLNEVAQRLGRHPTAITHQLQRKFGLSYSQYVGRLRIDMAKDLLRRTRLSVQDVARRVGVGDASNFSKLFRKFEGVSPLQFRTQFRSKR